MRSSYKHYSFVESFSKNYLTFDRVLSNRAPVSVYTGREFDGLSSLRTLAQSPFRSLQLMRCRRNASAEVALAAGDCGLLTPVSQGSVIPAITDRVVYQRRLVAVRRCGRWSSRSLVTTRSQVRNGSACLPLGHIPSALSTRRRPPVPDFDEMLTNLSCSECTSGWPMQPYMR